jgi:hypothetical protein
VAIEIRSYRSVFDLERRIYRIDRIRLNPGGVPLRGVAYFLAVLLGTFVLGALPLVHALSGAVPWYLREIALPTGGAALLTLVRIEGRPFHLAAAALVRFACAPKRLSGCRPCAKVGRRRRPGEILLLPDGSDARMRRLRYRGPGAVLVNAAHERVEWRDGPLARAGLRPRLSLRELPDVGALDRGQVVLLRAGVRLDVTRARG